ncbi:MAG: hypothetical protein ABEI54_04350 [Candidatus Bipolaricaulia bacterium]
MPDENPQKKLAHILGRASAYQAQVNQVRTDAIKQIPKKQQAINEQLQSLRKKIRNAGIGNDTESEQQYLRLLHDRQIADQIYAMNPPAEAVPPDLQKSIAYGQLLLEVYGNASQDALQKSSTAQSEIESQGRYLAEQENLQARELGEKLLLLVDGSL